MKTKPKSLLFRLLRVIVFAYVGLVAALAIFQRTIIYFPRHLSSKMALQQAAALSVEPWKDAAGAIIGWKRAAKGPSAAANRLLVFHGNSGDALDRVDFISGFEDLDQGRLWQVFVFEYPGFGARPGEISESSFGQASAAAVRQLRQEDARPLYLLGESLGSGLACATARDQPAAIGGVLLLTPYSSMADVASAHYPWVPVRWILRDRWDNVSALPHFAGPVAIILAGVDSVIPIAEGQKLFAVANQPKRLWIMPGVDHNELDFTAQAPWWRETSDFLLRKPGTP